MSHPIHTNRLIHEKSPYLLQHAHNPVDWYPWGDEAFAAAREQDKPIFLSIGYATCHWCHVMEKESFESPDIAREMNEAFINIKVDREEKPDVDSLYMEFAQAMMSGGAGWPLNVILTPELMPFFATTYVPSDAGGGVLGLKQLIERIHQIWSDPEERENIAAQAGKIVDVFANHEQLENPDLPTLEQITEAAELLFKTADPIYGGTKGAPKFPIGIQACFLLHLVRKSGDSRALFYVERTLEMMHRGGIYDHLGGGFSRYTIDEHWQIPHFEKMLYDNAILVRSYLETWELTRHHYYREVCEEILSYLLRDMQSKNGGFYSAEDADSEGGEGAFYTWTWKEIHSVLGPDAPLFCKFYGVSPGGNFEGKNVLHVPHSVTDFAQRSKLDPVVVSGALKELRARLWQEREKRSHPFKDDKVLTSWNGLAIYACAEAGRAFHNASYLDAAERAAQFAKDSLWQAGVLHRRWREGEARFDACLDDYAFLISGLLSLFEADRGSQWLEFAIQLNRVLDEEFKTEEGAYYLTNGKDPNLLLRRCEFYDGAEPSGNAVQAENLLRLHQLTGAPTYLSQAESVLRAAKHHIDLYPPGACYHLMALQRYLDTEAPSIVVSLDENESYRDEIGKMISAYYIPHKAVVWRRESDEELRDLAYLSRDKIPVGGKTTLYICHRDRCDEPITDLPKMWEAFEKLS